MYIQAKVYMYMNTPQSSQSFIYRSNQLHTENFVFRPRFFSVA